MAKKAPRMAFFCTGSPHRRVRTFVVRCSATTVTCLEAGIRKFSPRVGVAAPRNRDERAPLANRVTAFPRLPPRKVHPIVRWLRRPPSPPLIFGTAEENIILGRARSRSRDRGRATGPNGAQKIRTSRSNPARCGPRIWCPTPALQFVLGHKGPRWQGPNQPAITRNQDRRDLGSSRQRRPVPKSKASRPATEPPWPRATSYLKLVGSVCPLGPTTCWIRPASFFRAGPAHNRMVVVHLNTAFGTTGHRRHPPFHRGPPAGPPRGTQRNRALA